MLISKSRYLAGRQCQRRLWLATAGRSMYGPEPTIESDDIWTMREREGRDVELLVESLYSNSIQVASYLDVNQADTTLQTTEAQARETLACLDGNQPIFQACLKTDELLAIVDVLEPTEKGWYLWEIKASTSTSTLYEYDLAFQTEVARRNGLNIVGAGLWLLNGDYLRGEHLDVRSLLQQVDCTNAVFALRDDTNAEILSQIETLSTLEPPNVFPEPKKCNAYSGDPTGRRATKCGHLSSGGYCGSQLPTYWTGTLPRPSEEVAAAYIRKSDSDIRLLQPSAGPPYLTSSQQRVIAAVKSGEPLIDCTALSGQLAMLTWPLAFVDFEFDPGMAIPQYTDTAPYDRLPFQWSMHIQEEADSPAEQPCYFLHDDAGDPRKPFFDSLIEALPKTGSVVVHSKAAESTVLSQLGDRLKAPYDAHAAAIKSRLYDTVDLLRAGYYHPSQGGSYSIKKVAPAMLGVGYEGLAVQDGMAAVVEWKKMRSMPRSDPSRQAIKQSLLKYCERDTEMLQRLVAHVRQLSTAI